MCLCLIRLRPKGEHLVSLRGSLGSIACRFCRAHAIGHGLRAPEEVRRPALRGTAPVTPSAPTEEVSGAAAQLLGVDLDQG